VRTTFSCNLSSTPVVATAIHAGHDLRPEIAALIAVDEGTRLREEDPFTDVIIGDIGTRFVVHRSRFEVDINRPRDRAVYLEPDDAWGLQIWQRPLPPAQAQRSRAIHDDFYAALADHLDDLAADGPFLVLDVHSYNHRRAGPAGPPAPLTENPVVNVGTGYLDRARWGTVVDRFVGELGGEVVDGRLVDVRENVRFRGGYLSQWVAARYPSTACTLALEFKKVFMDEWTGEPDPDHLDELRFVVARVAERAAAVVFEEAS
jgi:N-formylglutamate amidohydrolase